MLRNEDYGRLGRILMGLVLASLIAPLNSRAAETQLEEITVTAQKREQSLQSVPIAVSAWTAEALDLSGVDTAIDIQVVTPGLTAGHAAAGWIARIRGIGSNDTSSGNESSVALYIDDVYVSGAFGGLVSLNNIERIEVLKGPQGTLFGRNATGGLVHVITKDPSHDAGGDFDISYGDYDTTAVNAYGTLGLGERVAADVAVHWDKRSEGWGYNPILQYETFLAENLAIRTKWVIDLGPNTWAKFSADYFERDQDHTTTYRFDDGSDFYSFTHDFPELLGGDGWGTSLRLDHDFGTAKFVSISSYRDANTYVVSDADYSPVPFLHGDFTSFIKSTTQEFQLLSPDDSKLDWIVGAFYMDRDTASDPAVLTGIALSFVGSSAQINLPQQETTSYSVYGQATFPVSSKTNLIVGLRYTSDDQDWAATSEYVPLAPGPSTIYSYSDSRKDSKWTYTAVIDHQFTPDIMGYISNKRGFKSGNFSMLTVPTTSAGPEVLTATEIGVKADVTDRFRINAAAYYYDFKDFQSIEVLGATAQIINAGKATFTGFEVEATAVPTDNWTVHFGFNWLPKSEYDDYVGCPGPQPPFPPFNVYDCSGSRVIGNPKWDVSLGTDYIIPTNVGDVTLALAYQYLSEFPWDADHGLFPVYEEPSRSIVNLQTKWMSPSERFTIALFGKNLTDEEYHLNATNANGAGARGHVGAPRTYGITFGYNF